MLGKSLALVPFFFGRKNWRWYLTCSMLFKVACNVYEVYQYMLLPRQYEKIKLLVRSNVARRREPI